MGGGTGTGTTVTFSFPTVASYWKLGYGSAEPSYLTALGGAAQQGVRDALQAWSNVASINFQEVSDNISIVGDIRVAYTSASSMDSSNYAYTYVNTGAYSSSSAVQGDVWVNATAPVPAGDNFSIGACGYNTLIHELGHAIGMDHPFGGDATVPDPGLTSVQNTFKYTVMAYCDAPGHWDYGTCSYYPTTPMLLDIAAAQYLYGSNMSYNSGDTTYTYNQGSNYYETIWDGGGNDTIVYNSTADGLIDLRAGNFSQLGNPIILSDGSTQNDTVAIAYGAVIENATGGSGNDTIYGNFVANLLIGGAGNDTLYGYGGNDTVQGGAGNDTLLGNAGDDVLSGDAGVDTMYGNAGNDTFYVDNTSDAINEYSGEGTDTVISSITYTLGSNLENLTLFGTGAIDGNGNELENTITGNSANNYIFGAAGNDTIYGNAGNDLLYGGGGNDTVSGGDGDDTLLGNIGDDTVNGDAGNDVLYGMGGNDIVNGGDGNDTLLGNIGDDTLLGGYGNDTLYGNPGNDILTGGAGNDIFVFNVAPDVATNVDTVTDFTVGTDILAVDDAVFTMLTVGALAANEFAAGAGFTTGQSAMDYFVYNTSTGDLYYDADGSGAGGSTLLAHLTSHLSLASNDFLVV
jgi:serralysin